VWGMQKLKIREDHVFLAQEFYDEDFKLVKVMTSFKIRMLGEIKLLRVHGILF